MAWWGIAEASPDNFIFVFLNLKSNQQQKNTKLYIFIWLCFVSHDTPGLVADLFIFPKPSTKKSIFETIWDKKYLVTLNWVSDCYIKVQNCCKMCNWCTIFSKESVFKARVQVQQTVVYVLALEIKKQIGLIN